MTASQKHETFAGKSIIHAGGFVPDAEGDPMETARFSNPYNAKIVPKLPELPAKEQTPPVLWAIHKLEAS